MAENKIADNGIEPLEIKDPIISDDTAEAISNRAAIDPKSLTSVDTENFIHWKKKRTEEYLKSQPKVPLFIPFKEGDDKNNKAIQYEFFGINGYYIMVKKGVMVEVPKPIADLWIESQQVSPTTEEFLLGNIQMKIDPVTGGRKDASRLVG